MIYILNTATYRLFFTNVFPAVHKTIPAKIKNDYLEAYIYILKPTSLSKSEYKYLTRLGFAAAKWSRHESTLTLHCHRCLHHILKMASESCKPSGQKKKRKKKKTTKKNKAENRSHFLPSWTDTFSLFSPHSGRLSSNDSAGRGLSAARQTLNWPADTLGTYHTC